MRESPDARDALLRFCRADGAEWLGGLGQGVFDLDGGKVDALVWPKRTIHL
jgi:hypothetical protein